MGGALGGRSGPPPNPHQRASLSQREAICSLPVLRQPANRVPVMPRWSVDIIRHRAEHLGTVVAPNKKEDIRPSRSTKLSLRAGIEELLLGMVMPKRLAVSFVKLL